MSKAPDTVKRLLGFTLMELMIVVAIVGILVAIAYPSYVNYLYKSRRSDAINALSQTQVSLERCYAVSFSYTGCTNISSTFDSPQGFYRINADLSNTAYTLTATPIGVQSSDLLCTSLILNQANVKTATGSATNPSATCWGVK
ncbi:MAG: type IV pilin protein [Legionella sp.]